MLREPRAIVFDLDDTLYPLQRFVRSGFAAVARELERSRGIDAGRALRVLMTAMRDARGRELQVAAMTFRLPPAIVSDLVDVIRLHRPKIRLPRATVDALQRLRRHWQIGVLTNGLPDLQERKVDSLGLWFMVDTVVYANAVGAGRGKPEREAFHEVSRRLGVDPARTVFVGNDERCDMFGASYAGMRTIHLGGGSCWADAAAKTLVDVPALAEQLVSEKWSLDVA